MKPTKNEQNLLIKNLQSKNGMKSIQRWRVLFFLCRCHFFPFSVWHIQWKEEKLWKWKKIVVALASLLSSVFSFFRFFLLFKIDNVEMIKCRYATTKQQAEAPEAEEKRKIIPYFDWCPPVNCVNFYIYLILFWKILLSLLLLLWRLWSKNRREASERWWMK